MPRMTAARFASQLQMYARPGVLEFENRQTVAKIPMSLVRSCRVMLNSATDWSRHFDLNVTILPDEDVQLLNREARKVDEPTDVLSFPLFVRCAGYGPCLLCAALY